MVKMTAIKVNNYKYGTRTKVINDILKLEIEVRFIPIHRETKEELQTWDDEYLARYRWILMDLRIRCGGND